MAMPIYEFLCRKCGHHFESFVRLGGEKNVCCSMCRSPDVQKLYSSFGIGGGGSRLKTSSSSCTSCSTKSCSTCR
ncbi:MAG: zinc ribbon domain-containing protein [Candidatus Aminicenantales bacterium]